MTQMNNSEMSLPARSLDVMRAIKENGGFTCTGSCKQIKKGQLHCRNLGNMLGMGPSVIWDVINALNERGIIERGQSDGPTIFNLTARGEEILIEGSDNA